ncbi:hypothetical protein VOLCADRAFT_90313 [Volvox carteri f. nagariensis]|uniref:Uncharacterized protein n=1 Tax=Volvox carteri f. nagariensis TaxID=3068 RepID=D8TU18_VOLCA|nr:uncharacterized protein VOLCADRAFT_90313 [Volvox carteri f. nagariensis]EFJ48961.1 hypothetical protein VOLCADRAFT_90313 [Volvox carteri f. nagariensis]|eukprot:XP_002949858.1 hypothetical protein VOLCADRAFT_90313 [Volvox carteri f. nagariensis]
MPRPSKLQVTSSTHKCGGVRKSHWGGPMDGKSFLARLRGGPSSSSLVRLSMFGVSGAIQTLQRKKRSAGVRAAQQPLFLPINCPWNTSYQLAKWGLCPPPTRYLLVMAARGIWSSWPGWALPGAGCHRRLLLATVKYPSGPPAPSHARLVISCCSCAMAAAVLRCAESYGRRIMIAAYIL